MGDVEWTDEAREAAARGLTVPTGVCPTCWRTEATQEQWDTLGEGERPDLCWYSPGHVPFDDQADVRQAAHLLAVLAPHVEAIRRVARAEALDQVTQAWQFKGWSDVLIPPPPGLMGPAQAVTDWLRARAEEESRVIQP